MSNDCETLETPVADEARADASSSWKTDSLTGGVLIVLSMMLVQRSIGFLRAILFCRWLDPEQLGLWDMAFGFIMLAGPFIVLSLPGTFGRYADYYRRRGRLRRFLGQTTLVCSLLGVLGACGVAWFRRDLSELIFGSPGHESLVFLVAIVLLAITAYNYALSLFTALRTVRLASAMEFVNGVSFAVLGVTLIYFWRCDASAVILAYGGSTLICVLAASYWYFKAWNDGAAVDVNLQDIEHENLWRKLLPFAAWLFAINLLTNLYGYTDRYLILHYAPGGEAEQLATVGQYHSARVVPLLLTSLAVMISGILLPHLSHDWEAGRHRRLSLRLNLFLKLGTLGLFAVAVAVLAVAPLLFEIVFRGKFSGGSAAMPGMLVAAIWFGAGVIAQQYLWCAERASRVGIALAVGLAVNIAVNLLLLPRLGLTAAVLAATASNVATLVLVLYFNHRLGFRVGLGPWILLVAAQSLFAGPWAAISVLAAILFLVFRTETIFNREEKEKILEKREGFLSKLKKYLNYAELHSTAINPQPPSDIQP
jgi:O-antigen/teichoic acid export membrane protein